MANQASRNRLAYVGRKPGSRDSDAWFIPVREAMLPLIVDKDQIELDLR